MSALDKEMEAYLAELEKDPEMKRLRREFHGSDHKTSRKNRAKPGGINIGYSSFDGTGAAEYGGCRWVKIPKGDE